MKVPFFDLKRLYLEQKTELDSAVQKTLESGWYILGETGAAFERELTASLSPARKTAALGCNSGTDALVLALLASEVLPGDEVITVSHTAIPTITAIRSIGATPVFVDVDPETWLMDTRQLDRYLTPRTKVVMLVHLYGSMIDVAAIQKTLDRAGRADVTVIEDVAQAQGAMLRGQQAGTIGRFGCFSFYPTKNIGCLGDGGGLFCRDEHDIERIRFLRNYGQKDRYHAHCSRGINSRLDEIQAAILKIKLPRLDIWNRAKAKMVETYREELKGLPLRFQSVPDGIVPAWHLCVVALESRARRDEFMGHLKERGVDTLIHYPFPCHTQPALAGNQTPSLPVTERLAGEIVSLPMNVGLRSDEQAHVIETAKAFFGRK